MNYLKSYIFSKLTMLVILCLPLSSFAFEDLDSLKQTTPNFEDVDVLIEYEWGDEEFMEEVKVFDESKTNNPHLVILLKNGICEEIVLFDGVQVSVFNHDTKKLLVTYANEKDISNLLLFIQ